MRFMIIRKADKDTEAGVMPSQELLAAMMKYNEEMVNAGVMLAGEGLHPTSQGARIKFSKGKPIVTDGPFTETKEVIGGWAVLQGTRAEVLRVATEFMELHRRHWPGFEGESEVRPIEELARE